MHVRIKQVPALALAAALQVLPMARVVCVNQAAAPSGFAIVFRWVAGAVALLGSYHAVSGASAAIAGLQNLNPIGPLTTNATGKVGQTFAYRIVVTNPGTDVAQDFFRATPLPPGLTINTNIGGNGQITGVPTAAGTYQVTLLAGNANYDGTVTRLVTITISSASGSSPPQITGPPTNQIVQADSTVTMTVTATGTSPLSYSWKFGSTPIAGATTSALQLSKVQTTNSGTYTVTVTNSAGSASASASLTVQSTSTNLFKIAMPQWANNAWSFQVSGPAQTNYIVWRSTDLTHWTPIQTNFSSSGTVQVSDPTSSSGAGFYRATLSP